MKRTRTCPKCGSRQILYVQEVADVGESTAEPARLAFVQRMGPFGNYGTGAGLIEAYVCSGCGYFEQYLREPLTIDGTHVKLLDAP
jgi:predicted nucleic-acid-binding Zn-ribbon protein